MKNAEQSAVTAASITGKRSIACRDVDSFSISVKDVTFEDWVGINFTLLIRELDSGKELATVFSLKKDDFALQRSGISEPGRNFLRRDRRLAANTFLNVVKVATDEEGLKTIGLLDTLDNTIDDVIAEWEGSWL